MIRLESDVEGAWHAGREDGRPTADGGAGRAGSGEELGGLRIDMQRTTLQGSPAMRGAVEAAAVAAAL